jgi:ABC-type antimicrobial peptide transport system permease subunit
MLSLLGSALGFVIGFQSASALASFANQDRVFDQRTAMLATMFCTMLNLLAAAIPARAAARLDPITALRFE